MDLQSRGRIEYQGLIGSDPERALAELRQRSPQMYDAIIEGAFGITLSHSELGRAERELSTMSMLAAAGGSEKQLATHTKAALRLGVAPYELRALAEHVTVYAGFPRGLNALTVIDQVLGEHGVARPAPMQRLPLTDHETVVAQRGDSGTPVVLIHALGLDWRMWEPVMDQLATSHRVFAYDIRGHGAAAGSPSPFTMPDTARDLLGVMDQLGLDMAHVVGLSYGGGIAQTAAVVHPEQFTSLSLLATTDFPFEAFEGRAHSGEVDGMEAQVVPSLTRWFTPEALAVNGWAVRYAREHVRRCAPGDWAAAWRAFKGLDVQGKLQNFQPPTLVLAGEHDASCTPEIMAGIAKRVLGSTYRELPSTPHMMSLEQPGLVADALLEFFASVDAAPR